MEKLVSWIRENGGYVDEDIYMEEMTPGNRTLKVRKEKPENTKLIDIPEKCCIKGETQILVCRALYKELQKKEESFFFPYLQTLPSEETLSAHPLYRYTKKDINPIFDICPEAGSILSNLIKNLELFLSSVHDKKLGKYCFVFVLTRSWNTGILPFADLVQYGFPPSCSLKERSKIFSRGLQQGQELTYMYRQMSHVDLYISYGVESQEINFLRIPVETPRGEKTFLLFSDKDFVQKTFQDAMALTKGMTPEMHKIAACNLLIDALKQIETKRFREDMYPEIHKLNSMTYKIVDNSLKILNTTATTSFISQKELSVGPTAE